MKKLIQGQNCKNKLRKSAPSNFFRNTNAFRIYTALANQCFIYFLLICHGRKYGIINHKTYIKNFTLSSSNNIHVVCISSN